MLPRQGYDPTPFREQEIDGTAMLELDANELEEVLKRNGDDHTVTTTPPLTHARVSLGYPPV